MKRAIVVCLGLLAPAFPAMADAPVAVVEEVQGKVTGAEFMDYVTAKTVIKIADGGSVVLSYMNSLTDTVLTSTLRIRSLSGRRSPRPRMLVE